MLGLSYNSYMAESNLSRNEDLVRKRVEDLTYWTWGKLSNLYKIKRPTAVQIFNRDAHLYATKEEIKAYKEALRRRTSRVRRMPN